MIEVRNLNKTYDRGSRNANHVLRDLSFTLPDTGFVCIVGESGCGKTSLLNAVGGLDRFDSGVISTGHMAASRYGSRDMETERNNSFGYIFQNYYLLTEHTVAYNVYLGLHALKLTHREKLERVREALNAVNMGRYARRVVGELSGGQQQRVAIARALARRPRVIFADEPTGNLDEENTLNICTLLRRISRTSLVVMVTHEMAIARFFADRIITLSDGAVIGDSDRWQRESFTAEGDSSLYAGDYEEQVIEGDNLRLRVLRDAQAAPAELTVAILNDRVVIKIADSRAVSCARPEEAPVIREGNRPVLTLESVDNEPEAAAVADAAPVPSTRAGSGLSFGMMLRESVSLLRGSGKRRFSAWAFLVVIAVLSTIIMGDYLTVSSIDPREFVITDPNILRISLERGPALPLDVPGGAMGMMPQLIEHLEDSGTEFSFVPNVSSQLMCSVESFKQLEGITAGMPGFSYAPLDQVSEDDLVFGRMPEKSHEVVIDIWVLEQFLAQDGVLQNTLSRPEDMLGATLSYQKKSFAPVIVGICDKGGPTLYMSDAGLISIGVKGVTILPLSEFKAMTEGMDLSFYGDLPADLPLEDSQCIVNAAVAGSLYLRRIGHEYEIGGQPYTIASVFTADSISAAVIVNDGLLEEILTDLATESENLLIHCADKGAMKAHLAQGLPPELEGMIQLSVQDHYGDSWARYEQEATLKADARLIISVTIILLSMVMLYLLQRSCVHSRIGMMAVYRLLGIPGRKLLGIFAVESLLLSLLSVLPATALTWAVVAVLTALPSLEFSMVLTWQGAGLVALCAMVYYLLVCLLPVCRLLRLPPARLAGKYDI